MANIPPHSQRRGAARTPRRPRPRPRTNSGAITTSTRTRPPTTGRRASFIVFACTIPFAIIVVSWQHAQLMERLEGGGEYAAYAEVDDDQVIEDGMGNWGESVQQAVDVVKFVTYGTGLWNENNIRNENNNNDMDVDDQIDDEINDEIDDEIIPDDDDAVDQDNSYSGDDISESASTSEQAGSIIPFDLSVNHLKLIVDAPGKPPSPPLPPHASSAKISEDFLPVVTPKDINFRWRHHPRAGSFTQNAAKVTAYRIVARRRSSRLEKASTTSLLLWDSDKVETEEGLPYSVSWPETNDEEESSTNTNHHLPRAGDILEWRVILWDVNDEAHTSTWSKFAVGPSDDHDGGDWKGQWIVHPVDMKSFSKDDNVNGGANIDACERWKMRRSLPIFKAQISSQDLFSVTNDEEDPLASALLVASGLGSFRVSMDGVPLSPSGPIDPPFTDYTKRVMYRGFDVTSFLVGKDVSSENAHSVGITMGSGWWDHRPLDAGIVKFKLLPRGPATVMAQLYLTTSKGKVHVVIPTQAKSTWKVTRGHIRESDLFTGEIVDVGVMSAMEGWDTPDSKVKPALEQWVSPVSYHTDVSPGSRREEIAFQAKAKERGNKKKRTYNNFASPIGKLVPSEIPPILPMERVAPDEIHDLGSGRWLFDFGKAFSGMLHFDQGLPTPIVPDTYPRAHGFKTATKQGDSFITVIYGESLEMTTGDINRVLVAGMGLHDGGPRHVSNPKGAQDNTPCFPEDQDGVLSQRDVYVFPKRSVRTESASTGKSKVRQSHFTTHAFRFAEVCCTAEPPTGVHALLYRTAFTEWGTFDSSNVLINGGYELVKNAMASNMLSVQSDCPHREKLPYGGDLVADSPAAMHMYDMSAFYKKTVQDWLDAQWDNGAYTETSIWQDLNDYAGIGHGAGETVWATAPPLITVRHMQHYGDIDLLKHSITSHVKWLEFLNVQFDKGMEAKGYDKELMKYQGDSSGLGDWLALRGRDTFLTHIAFYMASARCVAYIAAKLGNDKMKKKSLVRAEMLRQRIATLYLKNGKDDFDFPLGRAEHTPGPEMSLFAKIVPGEKRCVVLKNWFKRSGSLWPGDEEKLFLKELDESYAQEMVQTGELVKERDGYYMGWSQWQGFNEGIFAIRYGLKTLSDMGFHHIALRKAAGFGFGTPEYLMRHNATTMWESWWRSEDVYSRNHPMLGGIAEWMPSAVAGVGLFPTTVGGRRALFWPRFPKSAAMLEHASAVQGTPKGDFAVAWRFENLPDDKSQYNSASVKIRIRLLIPPGGMGTLRLPMPVSKKKTKISISHSTLFPDFKAARREADVKCQKRRKRRLGFPYSWEYDPVKKRWYKLMSSKSIGTPCESFLFSVMPLAAQWSGHADMTDNVLQGKDKLLSTGFYDIIVDNWKLEQEVEGRGRLGNIPEYSESQFDGGSYCKDSSTFAWHIGDATHII